MHERIISKLKIAIPFIYGDPLSYGRWLWINKSLQKKHAGKIIDLGCGRGTYVFALSKKGFNALGLTFDSSDVKEANARKSRFKIKNCSFRKVDLRKLDKEKKLKNNFDIAICSEVIEHLVNDEKLIRDISNIVKKDGLLFLTTPYDSQANKNPRRIKGIKEGQHVRIGYNKEILRKILEKNKFELISVSYSGGILSQKAKEILNILSKRNYSLGRIMILPVKIICSIFDPVITKRLKKDFASICITAKKIDRSELNKKIIN